MSRIISANIIEERAKLIVELRFDSTPTTSGTIKWDDGEQSISGVSTVDSVVFKITPPSDSFTLTCNNQTLNLEAYYNEWDKQLSFYRDGDKIKADVSEFTPFFYDNAQLVVKDNRGEVIETKRRGLYNSGNFINDNILEISEYLLENNETRQFVIQLTIEPYKIITNYNDIIIKGNDYHIKQIIEGYLDLDEL